MFLCQILSALCGLTSQTGVTRCFIDVYRQWRCGLWFSVFQLAKYLQDFGDCELLTTAEQQWKTLSEVFYVLSLVLLCFAGQANTAAGQELGHAFLLLAMVLVKTFKLKWASGLEEIPTQHPNAELLSHSSSKCHTVLWNSFHYKTAGKFSALK